MRSAWPPPLSLWFLHSSFFLLPSPSGSPLSRLFWGWRAWSAPVAPHWLPGGQPVRHQYGILGEKLKSGEDTESHARDRLGPASNWASLKAECTEYGERLEVRRLHVGGYGPASLERALGGIHPTDIGDCHAHLWLADCVFNKCVRNLGQCWSSPWNQPDEGKMDVPGARNGESELKLAPKMLR